METESERKCVERLRHIVRNGERLRVFILMDSYGRSVKLAKGNMACISRNWNKFAREMYTHLPHEVSQLALSGWCVSQPVVEMINRHFSEGAVDIETLFSRKGRETTFPPHIVIVVGGLNDVMRETAPRRKRPNMERHTPIPGKPTVPNAQKAKLVDGYVWDWRILNSHLYEHPFLICTVFCGSQHLPLNSMIGCSF